MHGKRRPRWCGGAAAAWLLVLVAVGWNLITLRVELQPVAYLNDSSVHEQMVRFAASALSHGHLPQQLWFPYLGLGSPQFLHYQSLGATVTGALGLLTGADTAFRLTLYLLLALWPLSVFLGARGFGLSEPAAGAAALLSPLLMGATGVGYEQKAYLWIGYGVWAQEWAMFTLPLAWGCTWRAIRSGRGSLPAVATTAATVALHYETGYLALAPLVLFPLLCPRPRAAHLLRAARLAGCVALCCLWVIVPLLIFRPWSATNEALSHGPLVNGYGAGRVLGWLVGGRVLDDGRLPVITLLALVGIGACLASRRHRRAGLAILALLGLSLVLSFGRTTFGGLAALLPGSADLFFRRFMMGAQLAALLLAGVGAATVARALARAGTRVAVCLGQPRLRVPLSMAGGAVVAAAALASPVEQLTGIDSRNASAIAAQRLADNAPGGQLRRLLALTRAGTGRTYAGVADQGGNGFRVGAVPVFKYLESLDIPEVGYTLRTASLMTPSENLFVQGNPRDYQLFGIRYLLAPFGSRPPVPAAATGCDGGYCLWELRRNQLILAGALQGVITANRTNVGERTRALLQQRGTGFVRVAWDVAAPRVPRTGAAASAASASAVSADLGAGRASATVTAAGPGAVAVLSASFDPGWQARVDGRSRPTIMVAPALPGVRVPPGRHRVAFAYHGYGGYGFLLGLAALGLLLAWALDRRQARGTAPPAAPPRRGGREAPATTTA